VTTPFRYLQAYPESLQQQVQKMISGPGIAAWLLDRHPEAHGVRTDGALYTFVIDLKNEFLRQADPINKVTFDSKLQIIQHALGLHTTTSRIQGSKLKAKRDIKVAALFKDTPMAFFTNDCGARIGAFESTRTRQGFLQTLSSHGPRLRTVGV